jgi:hypothetical protein
MALGIERFIFVEDNRHGLATCYNRFLDEHAETNALALFAHDDVSIDDVFVREKLAEGAERFVVQGLAGASSFNLQLLEQQTLWLRAPPEHLSGAVEHALPDGRTVWTSYGPAPSRCVVLDGLLLAVDLARIGNIRFDEQFSFHFYDLDFCLSAHWASILVGTINVHARHASSGDFSSPEFFEAQKQFRNKWQGLCGSVPIMHPT